MCGLCLLVPGFAASAAQTVTLPAWVCGQPDSVFDGGFEAADAAVPHDPSGGSGGSLGKVTRTVHVPGLENGTQTYYIFVPPDYVPDRSWPLMLVLHGYVPYPDTAASSLRDNWVSAAKTGHFLVAAPVAHEIIYNNGLPYGVTWRVPPSSAATDYDEFAAIRADIEAAYNIERTRIYGWGFSAGGMVMHDLGVNSYSAAFNAQTMAGYGVAGADLAGLACSSSAECDQALAALPRKIPVDIHIGTSDPNYTYAQSDHLRFLAQGWSDAQSIFYTTFPDGHTYFDSQLSEVWHNLCPSAVIP